MTVPYQRPVTKNKLWIDFFLFDTRVNLSERTLLRECLFKRKKFETLGFELCL